MFKPTNNNNNNKPLNYGLLYTLLLYYAYTCINT